MEINQEDRNYEFPVVLVESVHEKKKSFECTVCNACFGYKHVLARHIESKHEERKNYKCDVCDKTFSCKFSLKKHIELGHEGKKPFVCHICAATFRQKQSLKAHILLIHEGKGFECNICESQFLKRSRLNYHKEKVHDHPSAVFTKQKNIDSDNSCNSKKEEENKSIISEIKEKNVDVGTVLEKNKPFKCSKCTECFGYKHVLARHIKLRHEKRKPYMCNSCNLLFSEEYDLKAHIESVHEGRKTYRLICQNSKYTTVYIKRKELLACDDYQKKLENVSVIHGPSAISTKEDRIDFANSPYLQEKDIFISEIKEELTAKSIKTKKVECCICHKILSHKYRLLRHIESVHERIKPFRCEACASSFTEKRRLQEHIAFIHEGKTLYKCDTCQTSFSQKANLNGHIKTVHEKNKPFSCGSCNAKFSFQKDLVTHEKIKEPAKCRLCGVNFSPKCLLKVHMKSAHQEQLHKCKDCTKTFKLKSKLYIHIAKVHADDPLASVDINGLTDCKNVKFDQIQIKKEIKVEVKTDILDGFSIEEQSALEIVEGLPMPKKQKKLFQCEKVFSSFVEKQTLKRHTKSIHEIENRSAKCVEDEVINEEGLNTAKSYRTKKVECGICHKIIYQRNLLKHIRSVHERIKPFRCETCASSFAEKKDMLRHIGTVHEGKKLYKCDTCQTSFSQKANLNGHIKKVHEKNKPFSCGSCNAKFSFQKDLVTHEKIKEPANCRLCGANFSPKCLLKVHMTSAHQEQLYKCKDCNKTFKLKSKLYTHIAKVHADDPLASEDIYGLTDCKNIKFDQIQIDREKVQEGKKLFQCEICFANFAEKQTFERHITSIHEMENHSDKYVDNDKLIKIQSVHEVDNPFSCLFCEIQYADQSALDLHISSVHQDKELLDQLIASNEIDFVNETKVDEIQKPSQEMDSEVEQVQVEKDVSPDQQKCLEIKLTLNEETSIEDKVTKEAGLYSAKSIKKPFQCETCVSSFAEKRRLNDHIALVHEGKSLYDCNVCNSSFSQRKSMLRHVATVHEGKKMVECNICHKILFKKDNLKRHIASVHEKKKLFKCEMCNHCFSESGTLKKHVLTVHEGVKPFQCKICKDRFADKSGMNRHVKSAHEEKKFECQLCYKLFSAKYTLNGHILRVHEKKTPYKCTHCEKEFAFKKSFNLHVKNIICQRRSNFNCDFCNDGFPFKQDMLNHIESVHKVKPNFICEICSKSFFTATKLKNHNFTVHQEKPRIVCDICGDSLKTKACLDYHVTSVHQGTKPFTCELCGKSFTKKLSLNQHISVVHNGKKPYKCEFCDANFSQKGNMKKHVLYHHKPN